MKQFSYYEFFAGGGMARAGLGAGWQCLFANDIDPRKAESYAQNWGAEALHVGDVGALSVEDLPDTADLAWASFPCQDLSLAGDYRGLKGKRSGTFWPFWRLMDGLSAQGRGPCAIVVENVCGLITSHSGKDFAAITGAMVEAGYSVGALIADAVRFLPQSRPRLFIIAVKSGVSVPSRVAKSEPSSIWHSASLIDSHRLLPDFVKEKWIWWTPSTVPQRSLQLNELIETAPMSVDWHSSEETEKILSLMSPLHLDKVRKAQLMGQRMVGCIYKRTRANEAGQKTQRAEVRFDGLSGCLRTPGGGSSRQILFVVEQESIRSRLLSSREAARLMGLPDSYKLPANYNEAYHLVGDGVVIPAVRFLADAIIEPVVRAGRSGKEEAA